MNTVKQVLSDFDQGLGAIYDKPEADTIKYLALNDVSGFSKAQLRAFPEHMLNDEQTQKLNDILQQLQTGKPLQYILGHTEFYGLPFKVSPAVLIPRPETEELVQWVLTEMKKPEAGSGKQNISILDVGTGSGCIPVTLKKHLPNATVSAIDISREALQIARQNAGLNEVEINFIEQNILKLTTHHLPLTTKYSVLISNPPYVTQSEKQQMHRNVLNHEPHLALFVEDNDPLVFYNAIADYALQHLDQNGLLFFEINENSGKQTVELLQVKGFINIELRKDMRGKDRMIKATTI